MAAKEMYDYLSTATPDYSATTLSVTPTDVLVEDGQFNQALHQTDDNGRNVVTLADTPIFVVRLQWQMRSEEDAGTIVDFYFDTDKAKGMARSFKWSHPLDGHTYVVKFASPLPRGFSSRVPNRHNIDEVQLAVLGVIADA
ncbi:MAG: hypothetical protein M0R18_15615 [Deltaproteobacteria bacterium]|nr:hypothetical protein [Deltaproteobacteria bacterium]